jgi:prepilin-type N-terminal cleavage/methylation domain-containing protein
MESTVKHGTRNRGAESTQRRQRGFTLLEVLISMVVLTVGLISLAGVFGLAMANTQTSQQDLIAKQLANEAMESMFTARDTAQLTWGQIQNSSVGGIFLDGAQPMFTPGNDGIIGTADDATTGTPQVLHEPGPDGIFGTSDDVSIPLSNYQRTILIQPVIDAFGNTSITLRNVTITIQYTTPQFKLPKTFVLTSYISQFR